MTQGHMVSDQQAKDGCTCFLLMTLKATVAGCIGSVDRTGFGPFSLIFFQANV